MAPKPPTAAELERFAHKIAPELDGLRVLTDRELPPEAMPHGGGVWGLTAPSMGQWLGPYIEGYRGGPALFVHTGAIAATWPNDPEEVTLLAHATLLHELGHVAEFLSAERPQPTRPEAVYGGGLQTTSAGGGCGPGGLFARAGGA